MRPTMSSELPAANGTMARDRARRPGLRDSAARGSAGVASAAADMVRNVRRVVMAFSPWTNFLLADLIAVSAAKRTCRQCDVSAGGIGTSCTFIAMATEV